MLELDWISIGNCHNNKKYSLQAKESMTKMLNMIGNHLPREAGNGWKLPTFHNTMHMVDDMCKYGKPKEAHRGW
jgi:hypothetical protein